MRAVFLLCFLTLAGCASAPPDLPDLTGKDPARANIDMTECRAKQLNGELPFIDPVTGERAHYYSRCMEQRGYTMLSRVN